MTEDDLRQQPEEAKMRKETSIELLFLKTLMDTMMVRGFRREL